MKIRQSPGLLHTMLLMLLCSQAMGQDKTWMETALVENDHFEFRITTLPDNNSILSISKNGEEVRMDSLYENYRIGELEDFNQDGFVDFFVHHYSPFGHDVKYLFLYDSHTANYRLVNGFSTMHNAKMIPYQKTYYFTFFEHNCHHLGWRSRLFVIDNFEVIELGRMRSKRCAHFKDIPIEVVIPLDLYRSQKVETISSDDLYLKKGYEWTSISSYWSDNIDKFKKSDE